MTRRLHYKDASRVFLDDRERSAGSLQQSRQLSFDKTDLLIWIAHVTERRPHVVRTARLTLEQHIVSAQVDLRRLTGSAQLFQMAVTKFALLILLVADRLRISNPFGNRRSSGRGRNLFGCF
jgi:hypothetical protein